MLKAFAKVSIIIACAVSLGGCSTLLGGKFARFLTRAKPVQTASLKPAAPAVATATETGRQQLTDGDISLAVKSFQEALASGEPIAPAANGLGVAFARLGRQDLALRYFQEAASVDPDNQRYAENIDRVMRSPDMHARMDVKLAATARKAAATVNAPQLPVLAGTASPVGKLQRLSRGELTIVTAMPQPAPILSAALQIDKRFRQPVVRISLPPPASDAAPSVPH